MSHSPQDVHKKVLGAKGERLVEAYLKKQGMKIVARNYRTPFGEADLVAELGDETVCGALKTHISTPTKDFQPMNANFGILTPLDRRIKDKKERYRALAERALESITRGVMQ